MDKTISNQINYQRKNDKRKKSDLEIIVSVFKNDETMNDKYPYPAVPDALQLYKQFFAGFGVHMPEK